MRSARHGLTICAVLVLALPVLLAGLPPAPAAQSAPESRMPRHPGQPILIGDPAAPERMRLFLIYSDYAGGARKLFLALTGYSPEYARRAVSDPVDDGRVAVELFPAYRTRADLWVDMAARCSSDYVAAMQALLVEKERWSDHPDTHGERVRVAPAEAIAAIRDILVPERMTAERFETCVYDKGMARDLLHGLALLKKQYPVTDNVAVIRGTVAEGWLNIVGLMAKTYR
ncbi:MAG: hypothetical protein D6754_07360 [Alphaproteobacteria bacterium]|nr:MAG: hypothetical protein D6754_07360 [Alphaproteobacteria bacterium]